MGSARSFGQYGMLYSFRGQSVSGRDILPFKGMYVFSLGVSWRRYLYILMESRITLPKRSGDWWAVFFNLQDFCPHIGNRISFFCDIWVCVKEILIVKGDFLTIPSPLTFCKWIACWCGLDPLGYFCALCFDTESVNEQYGRLFLIDPLTDRCRQVGKLVEQGL